MIVPQNNTGLKTRSNAQIVTSLGIYSKSNTEQKNRNTVNSTKTIKQMMCLNNNQEQQPPQSRISTKQKTTSGEYYNGIDIKQTSNINISNSPKAEPISSQRSLGRIIQSNNLRNINSYSNYHMASQSSSSYIGEFRQYNRQFYSGPEHNYRESQILVNKQKSNIILIQNQIKQIIKLTLFTTCVQEQVSVKQEITALETSIRKLKLSIQQMKGNQNKVKQNHRKIRQLTLLINQQKKVHSQLQAKLLSLSKQKEEMQQQIQQAKQNGLTKIKKCSKFITQSQDNDSKLMNDYEAKNINIRNKNQISSIRNYMDQTDIDESIQQNSQFTSIYNIEENGFNGITQQQSQCSSESNHLNQKQLSKLQKHRQKLQMTNNTLNFCYERVLKDQQSNSQLSQYSDIVKQSAYKFNKNRKSEQFHQRLFTNFKFSNQQRQKSVRGTQKYKKLLKQRIKILKQQILLAMQDYDKKGECITKQKICIRKNIELFKLEAFKIDADKRKLNKMLMQKQNRIQIRTKNLSSYKKIKSLQNEQKGLGMGNNNLKSSRKLIYMQTRKVYAIDKEHNSSPFSHRSLSRRSSHRSLKSTGQLNYISSQNKYKQSRLSNNYKNNYICANQEYFGTKQ